MEEQRRFNPVGVKQDVEGADSWAYATEPKTFCLSKLFSSAVDLFVKNGVLLIATTFVLGVFSYVAKIAMMSVQNLAVPLVNELTGGVLERGFGKFAIDGVTTIVATVFREAFMDGLLLEGFMISFGLIAYRKYLAGSDEPLQLKDGMHHFKKLPSVFLVSFGGAFLSSLGFALGILPGIVLMLLFTFSLCLVIDQDETPLQALKISSRVVIAHRWSLVPVFLTLLGISMLYAVSCGLGGLVAEPISGFYLVAVYLHIFEGFEPRPKAQDTHVL